MENQDVRQDLSLKICILRGEWRSLSLALCQPASWSQEHPAFWHPLGHGQQNASHKNRGIFSAGICQVEREVAGMSAGGFWVVHNLPKVISKREEVRTVRAVYLGFTLHSGEENSKLKLQSWWRAVRWSETPTYTPRSRCALEMSYCKS